MGAAALTMMLALGTLAGPPEPLLDRLYHAQCHRPVAFWGYSFADSTEEMAHMAAAGATCVASGRLWGPTYGPGPGPFGLSHRPASMPEEGIPLGQRFEAVAPFDRIRATMPTWTTTGSGCTLTLYRASPETPRAATIAAVRIREAQDKTPGTS